jgi:hypothetical protein
LTHVHLSILLARPPGRLAGTIPGRRKAIYRKPVEIATTIFNYFSGAETGIEMRAEQPEG